MQELNVGEICDYLDGKQIEYKLYGSKDTTISGMSMLKEYIQGTIVWIKNIESYLQIYEKKDAGIFSFVVTDEKSIKELKLERCLVSENSKFLFFEIVKEFFDESSNTFKKGQNIAIGKDCHIADDAVIGNNCVIGSNVSIGNKTKIYHNVVIHDNVKIGNECVIKSGSVIGEEGFGYSKYKNKYHHLPHLGSVVIGDYVEIGANTCVDRGTIGNTVIGEGTKIDNLCHIAHNCEIGKNVMITGCTMVSGSVTIEDGVYIAPNSTILNQLKLKKNSYIGIGSSIITNTRENVKYASKPARVIGEIE